METIRCDVAIIGAGSAGLTAYRSVHMAGKHPILIEGGPYGTTCARVGCMPSKLLIAAAEAAHSVKEAPGFGVHPGPTRIDGKEVMARVRSERDRFVGFVLSGMERMPEEHKLRGYARFLGPNRLQVDQHTIVEAKGIVIATGSTPQIPPAWAAAGDRVITSDAVFDWTDLPRSVAVVGTGVIGLELGQALHRLGVHVVILARGSSVAQLSDPAVKEIAAAALREEMDVRFHTQVSAVERVGDGVRVTSRDTSEREVSEVFDYLLVATGRKPNVDQLSLELTGIALDEHGIPQYDSKTMQCGDSHIFIAGDANNELPLLPEAADQGKIAGANAATWPEVKPGLRRTPLIIAFTEPNIATVGASYEELCRTHKGSFAVGMVSFEDQGRSRVMRQNKGMLRVYGEYGSGRFLGAESIGPRMEHIGHLLSWAHQTEMTVEKMLEMPFYHPVVEEGLRTALRDLAQQLEKAPPPKQSCPDCTPGC
ncbi:dihydrolipoyl dehydrogenase [Pseudoduganella sp. RAF19]|uniref:dihydrolipoyl dehydrogenase n=1 Tax=Pseudoduganella sp. RAF19 TaxID=3233052 RepID=UPI003F9C9A4A